MPFTLVPQVAKSDDTPPHVAAAQAHQEHLHEQSGTQMARGADRPISDEEAAKLDDEHEEEQADKSIRQHPDSGRFMGQGETAFGASSPLHTALAQHRAPAPLATLQTVGAPALASSYAPGEVRVQSLDYRGAVPPLATAVAPIQPAPHTAPNEVRS